jgi:hypothetical protein
MGFVNTTRKVISVVSILIALVLALGMFGQLYEFYLFRDSWFLSTAIAYGIFIGIFGGLGWIVHPPDSD